MKISAIICTHNRREMLVKALASLVVQDLPPADYEIIVVDNASSDGTREAVEALHGGLPNLVYAYEPALGVSHARNRGISLAHANVVAYLDDDAQAVSGWLSAMIKAFEDEPARPLCVGGRVLPLWEREPASWLPELARSVLSIIDYGEASRPLDFPGEWVAGASMAVNRDFLLASGFDPRLGRRGANLIGNEENALLRAVVAAGGLIKYEPAATVHHHVAAERLKLGWLCRRLYAQGVSNVLLGPGPVRVKRGNQLGSALKSPPPAGLLQLLLIGCYAVGVVTETVRQKLARYGAGG